jgi:peptidoglycan/xylan/chitin deacetylase (PgdA/CDA1 family)
MTRPTPKPSPDRPPARAGAALLLLTAGLLAGCAFPGLGSRHPTTPAAAGEPAPAVEQPAAQPGEPPPPAQPAEPPPSAPDGPNASEGPSEAPRAPEEPKEQLPAVPEGEPSKLIVHGDRSCKMVALTYDAGSGADGAEAILDMLKRHSLKVTFFLTGKWVEKYPDLAKRIAEEGHEIANHTYSHPDLTKLPDAEVVKQIKDGEEAIIRVTGKDPKPLFREPYGAFSDHERRLVRQAGYSYSIYWDLDTLDWQFPGVDAEVAKIMKAQGGSVVLMHLNVPDSAVASDKAIPLLQEKGYAIVPVFQLLQCSGQQVQTPG